MISHKTKLKMRAAARLLKKIDYNLHKLKKYGYIRKFRSSSSGRLLFVKDDIVIKNSFFTCGKPRKNKFIVPSIILEKEDAGDAGYDDGFYAFVIQPLCDTKNKKKASLYFKKLIKEGKMKNFTYDLYPKNVGWLNNKPVIFDW